MKDDRHAICSRADIELDAEPGLRRSEQRFQAVFG